MLSPNELRARSFTRAMRGYNTAEVDEYIDFVIDKYEELFRENDELNNKLNAAMAKLDELKEAEDTIRTTLTRAQAASRTIIKDANKRSDLLLRSVKGQCDSVIADMRDRVAEEKKVLAELNRQVSTFKTTLYNHYSTHIEQIERISGESYRRADINIDQLTQKLVDAVKRDIAGAENSTARISDDANKAADQQNIDDIIHSDAENPDDNAPAQEMDYDDVNQNIEAESDADQPENLNNDDDAQADFISDDVSGIAFTEPGDTREFTVPLSVLRKKKRGKNPDDMENPDDENVQADDENDKTDDKPDDLQDDQAPEDPDLNKK